MKLLLDECIPQKLKRSLVGHDCLTVREAGFAGKRNGELLSLAERAGFEVLLTVDQGIEYEQNLVGRRIAVLMLFARSNRLSDLLPLTSFCLGALNSIQSGQLAKVGR